MEYCKKCLLPDTKPNLKFDEEGICFACRNYDHRENIDWDKRRKKLERLCKDHINKNGEYDCVIPISGGKDSHWQTQLATEELGLNPLLVVVDFPFTDTDAGEHNVNNLSRVFNCDTIRFKISPRTHKKATRVGFEELGRPAQFVEAATGNIPIKIADRYDIPLVFRGEDGSLEFGTGELREEVSFERMMTNKYNYDKMVFDDISFWEDHDEFNNSDLQAIRPPTESVKDSVNLYHLGNFFPYHSYKSYQIAKRKGFKTVINELPRSGNVESFDQIDQFGYLVDIWLKYPKFGHARTTDVVSRWIRRGFISRKEGKKLVMKYDHKIDQSAIEDFCDYTDYTIDEFWDIVDEMYNNQIFEKNEFNEWKLTDPVYSDVEDEYTRAEALEGVHNI